MNYSVYSLREKFKVEPKSPSLCPYCDRLLISKNLQRSKGVENYYQENLMFVYFYNILFQCKHCNWWFFRERWEHFEYASGSYDFIVVGVKSDEKNQAANDDSAAPWEIPLGVPDLYNNTQHMPDIIYKLFKSVDYYKQSYYELLNPKPVWPMKMKRITAIYNTMSRTIRKASSADKQTLKEELLKIAEEFDHHYQDIVVSTSNAQETYNSWFFSKVDQLKEIPFFWQDANKINHTHIELGLAQKFINLMIKDWWCVSKNSKKVDVSLIHAPFDNVMWKALWEVGLGRYPSLQNGGYYVNLSKADYLTYQKELIHPRLKSKFGIAVRLTRIEIEQFVWSLSVKQR